MASSDIRISIDADSLNEAILAIAATMPETMRRLQDELRGTVAALSVEQRRARSLEDEVGQQRRTTAAVLARAREAEAKLEAYRDGSAVVEATKRVESLERELLEVRRSNGSLFVKVQDYEDRLRRVQAFLNDKADAPNWPVELGPVDQKA